MPVVSLRSAYFPELDVAHSVKPVINRYDEYGVPQTGFSGRFGYAGALSRPPCGREAVTVLHQPHGDARQGLAQG